MYSPQQLYQFIQFAKQYLESEDFEFKSGNLLVNPNNEEDINTLIAIALAEHRDGDVTSGFAANKAGDNEKSRGPWQIHIPTWEKTLRKYDIFNSYDSIETALDDPGLNAVAALIIAQSETGDDRTYGINNWQTVMNKQVNPDTGKTDIIEDDPFQIKAGVGNFVEKAKEYDTAYIENPEMIQKPDGTIEEIPAEPLAVNVNRGEKILENTPLTIKQMMSALQSAKDGTYFSKPETYVSYKGNNIRKVVGSDLNNDFKNMYANIEVKDLSPKEVVDMYVKDLSGYLPYGVTYRKVNMKNEGRNIVDLVQNKNVNNQDYFYDASTGSVITGDVVNKRVNSAKNYMYRYYLSKNENEPLAQIDNVYEYLFRTIEPYVKISEDAANALSSTPSSNNLVKESGYNPFPSMFSGENEVRRSGYNPVASAQEAAPTFLNNLEKILRVKPQGNKIKKQNPRDRNAFRSMFGG
jgi:hypothetical protein